MAQARSGVRWGSLRAIISVWDKKESPRLGSVGEEATMYARVTNLRFPPEMRMEVVGAAQGLVPVLRKQPGFSGITVLSDRDMGEGIILSFWETEADAEASESSASYIGQMSMMSSFLYESLIPRTYEVDIRV